MRVMIFIDLENFRHGVWNRNTNLELNYHNVHFFLFKKIISKLEWDKYNPRLIRAYVYTGELTDGLISRIRGLQKNFTYGWKADNLKIHLEKVEKLKKIQEKIFAEINNANFIQLKTIPLKYEITKGPFQKGIDVQIATDLVSHAYQDNFDVAILCSGDMDLVESIKIVKNLGKKMILIACKGDASPNIIKESDHFFDIHEITNEELTEMTQVIGADSLSS